MAATTVTRESMTDNVTVWNVTRIGSAIYDRIDAILAGNVIIGGTVSSEGFGTHNFSSAGTGANLIAVRNTTAGTGNFSELRGGNDSSATVTRLITTSSTYTPSGTLFASGSTLDCSGAGGLTLAASNASGDLRLYSGNALRLTIGSTGTITPAVVAMHSAFLAYNSADDTGVTTGSTIDFDTETYDVGSNFSADTFTAPTTGVYLLHASVNVQNLTGGAIDMGAYIVTSNKGSGYYIGFQSSVANNGQCIFSGCVLADMDAADTAVVKYEGTGNATVRGSGTLGLTFFGGRRVI